MTAPAKSDWLIPTGLIALSVIPILAGIVRLMQLGGNIAITPENARFFAAPMPVTLHIVCTAIYCVLGAFQFAPGFRRRKPDWHRLSGRILIPCGLMVALTGLWMTQFYPHIHFDGPYLYVIRLLVGTAMTLFLCLGLASILKRDIPQHRAWMLRSYALGLGAGTQVFTHIPWFLFPSIHGELARTLCMAAGWIINLAVAEWLMQRRTFRL